jgi:hypothetical protein
MCSQPPRQTGGSMTDNKIKKMIRTMDKASAVIDNQFTEIQKLNYDKKILMKHISELECVHICKMRDANRNCNLDCRRKNTSDKDFYREGL